jgi:hypothetical protein
LFTKVQGLLRGSLGLGARDHLAAKVGAKVVGGLPKHKVCLRGSLEP